ncbi:MAG: peptidylprolyl isomerase [Bacteroidales bacterium]|nr:peptidylprolyl isomerase [Bacteroidales bacterium]
MGIILNGCGPRGGQKQAQEGAEKDSAATVKPQEPAVDSAAIAAAAAEKEIAEEPILEMVTSMGSMKIKLYKETPQHRDNFVKLARKGYYNGLLFHRVIRRFMIQAGDPLTRDTTKVDLYGSGGPNYTIPAEIVPGLTHKKGALAAARKGDSVNPERASSGSQFYIVQDPDGCKHLDGEYTIFGEVIEGINVVDNIAKVETNAKGLPLYPIRIISVKEIK